MKRFQSLLPCALFLGSALSLARAGTQARADVPGPLKPGYQPVFVQDFSKIKTLAVAPHDIGQGVWIAHAPSYQDWFTFQDPGAPFHPFGLGNGYLTIRVQMGNGRGAKAAGRPVREAFAIAALPQAPGEPLDWLNTTCPTSGNLGERREKRRFTIGRRFQGRCLGVRRRTDRSARTEDQDHRLKPTAKRRVAPAGQRTVIVSMQT